jgi:hypothetical protein
MRVGTMLKVSDAVVARVPNDLGVLLGRVKAIGIIFALSLSLSLSLSRNLPKLFDLSRQAWLPAGSSRS